MADSSNPENSGMGGSGGSSGNLLDNLKKGLGATAEKAKELGAVAAEKAKVGWEVTAAKTNEGLSKSREFIHDHTKPGEAAPAEGADRAAVEEEKPNLLASISKKTGEIINNTKGAIHDITKPKAEKEAGAKADAGDDDV